MKNSSSDPTADVAQDMVLHFHLYNVLTGTHISGLLGGLEILWVRPYSACHGEDTPLTPVSLASLSAVCVRVFAQKSCPLQH